MLKGIAPRPYGSYGLISRGGKLSPGGIPPWSLCRKISGNGISRKIFNLRLVYSASVVLGQLSRKFKKKL